MAAMELLVASVVFPRIEVACVPGLTSRARALLGDLGHSAECPQSGFHMAPTRRTLPAADGGALSFRVEREGFHQLSVDSNADRITPAS